MVLRSYGRYGLPDRPIRLVPLSFLIQQLVCERPRPLASHSFEVQKVEELTLRGSLKHLRFKPFDLLPC